MRIAQEEVFGPVLAVLRFRTEEDAIRIANDVRYGLAAGIWTQGIARAINVANRLQAGTIWINNYRMVSYMTPFGGFKASGIGRENGAEAIKEFMQVKSIWLSTGTAASNPFVIR
jgi:aldehyde dehydrogenase (NAD+)